MKRLIDLAVSGLAILILSPGIIVVAVLVRIRLGPPVFFRQYRPGLHSEPFRIVKFRSMAESSGENGALRPDSDRLP